MKKFIRLLKIKKNSYGSGGMSTKLEAAKICINSGCHMAIANGKPFNPLDKLIKTNNCTWFLIKVSSLDARKKWIVSSIGSKEKYSLIMEHGKALKNGKSLLMK